MPRYYISFLKPQKGVIIDSISVTTPPTKTSYMPGESFDPTGMVVTASARGMTGNVTSDCTFFPTTFTTSGTQTVRIKYQGCTTTTTVSVVALESLTVTTEPTKTIYRDGETLDLTGIEVTADYGSYTTDVTAQCTFSPVNGTTVTTSMTEITISFGGVTASQPLYVIGNSLEATDWKTIQGIGAKGLGSQYWSVGDRKLIHVSGNVGDYITLNQDFYVFVVHFNYRNQNGVYFGGFKEYNSSLGAIKDIVLYDSSSSPSSQQTDGTKHTNFNHWGAVCYGGWKGCDFRYDILGSTDIAPSGYGAIATEGRVGYDASSTCATNPKANTLMSCLPENLRSVMAPITIYTDNSSTSIHNLAENVTASVDYLPIPAESEIMGSQKYANTYEQNYVTRLSYYSGTYIIPVRYNSNTNAGRALRSPRSTVNDRICYISSSGGITYNYTSSLLDFSVWFRVA